MINANATITYIEFCILMLYLLKKKKKKHSSIPSSNITSSVLEYSVKKNLR